MTFLAIRLKELRHQVGNSLDAMGAQGFVTRHGWVKVENGLRPASEELIDRLVRWLVQDKYIVPTAAVKLREELIVLKYLGSPKPGLRDLAGAYARTTTWGQTLLARYTPPTQFAQAGKGTNDAGILSAAPRRDGARLGWISAAFLNVCHILRLSWVLLLAPFWIPVAMVLVVVLLIWIGGCVLRLAAWFQDRAERPY